jgi:Tat protein translocase TatB subunit
MNIFSNIGITELLIILLLALVVVGPERLPELGRKLGETLRDLRKAYDNLTSDLGPELMSIQKTTQELRDSVNSVTSIPQDMVQSIVKAADLDDTIDELKDVAGSVDGLGKTISSAGKVIRDPLSAAASTARESLTPPKPTDTGKPTQAATPEPRAGEAAEADAVASRVATGNRTAADTADSAGEAVPFAEDSSQLSGDGASQDSGVPESAEPVEPLSAREEVAPAEDAQETGDE